MTITIGKTAKRWGLANIATFCPVCKKPINGSVLSMNCKCEKEKSEIITTI